MKADMQDPQLKKFLSMDLAERLIRVEQTVAASFNQPVPYDKTAYYLSMTSEQKRDFDRFLGSRKRRKMMLLSSFLLSIFGLSVFGAGITGSAISSGASQSFSTLEIILTSVFGILLICAGYFFVSDRMKNKRFEKHAEVVHNLVVRKRVLK